MTLLRSVFWVAAMVMVGCAPASPSTADKPLPPPPSNFSIDADGTVNLPAPLSFQTGLPSVVKAKLHADAHSEALPTTPLSSHHDGHMSLVVTDGTGKQTIVNINCSVSGDSEGTPTQGLGEAISRFLDTASLMSRPLNHLPTTTP